MYLSQGLDYLGFLEMKLRDLEGWSTLANELIQNADDAQGVTRIRLDVRDDALVVWNDATFRDCGRADAPRCVDDTVGDGRKCCDFHAFRRVASGHKREEDGTTGAFGIGFVSVYQITDQPALRSGFWHWRMDPSQPEDRRIAAERVSACYSATEFRFPWARENSAIRQRLRREPIRQDVVEKMAQELRRALTRAAPFLKRLTSLELLVNGAPTFRVQCERDPDSKEILVDAGGTTRVWRRFMADFASKAQQLRDAHKGRIEVKRRSLVTLGVPLDETKDPGRLYASLPTECVIDLPILIDADFYPSTSRKQILLDGDYQGIWNRAAIEAAAQAFAGALPRLCSDLKPAAFWQLLEKARLLHDDARKERIDHSFGNFWIHAKAVAQTEAFVQSSRGTFHLPQDSRFNGVDKEALSCLPFLEALGLHVVHQELRPAYTALKEVGVRELDLEDLTQALHAAGLTGPSDGQHVPQWLRSPANRRLLATAIDQSYSRMSKERLNQAQERLQQCSLWLTAGGQLAPAAALWQANATTQRLFASLVDENRWMAEDNPAEWVPRVRSFDLSVAVAVLEKHGPHRIAEVVAADESWLHELLGWIELRAAEILQTRGVRERLRKLAIWPCGDALHSLDNLVVPGDFTDPMHLARVLRAETAERFRTLLVNHLHAKSLDLRTYLTDQVPAAFNADQPPAPATRRALLHLVAEHIGQFRDDSAVRSSLERLPLVECGTGQFSKPGLVYFNRAPLRAVLGDDVGRYCSESYNGSLSLFDTLKWLGVAETPNPADMVQRAYDIADLPTHVRKEAAQALFKGLVDYWATLHEHKSDLEELKELAWLPVNKAPYWAKPAQAYTSFRDYLFESQALFLDVHRQVQGLAQHKLHPGAQAESVVEFFGIRGEPTCAQVVDHLLHETQTGRAVRRDIFVFLNQHASEPVVVKLRETACLPIDGNRCIAPSQAFRGPHRFGSLRYQLGSDWLTYPGLLNVWRIPEQPTARDAVAVLQEMARRFSHVQQLSSEEQLVNAYCWELLSAASDEIGTATWDGLSQQPVVPNSKHFLHKPTELFFEDRSGLADKFGDTASALTIRRIEGAWPAMALAGVRNLGDVVKTRIVEFTPTQGGDARWAALLDQRWPLVRRVVATAAAGSVGETCPQVPPTVREGTGLTLEYAFLGRLAPAEHVVAHMDREIEALYVSCESRGIEVAMARELALLLQPEGNAVLLAATLKEVLSGATADDARLVLNELGFADIELSNTASPDSSMGAEPNFIPDDADEGHDPSDAETASAQGNTALDQLDDDASSEEHQRESVSHRRQREFDVHGHGRGHGSTSSSSAAAAVNKGTKTGAQVLQRRSGKASTTPGVGAGRHTSPNHSSPTTSGKLQSKLILRSYVDPQHDPADVGNDSVPGTGNARVLEIDRQGTARVMAFEKQQRRQPQKMDHYHPGYDIESRDAQGQVRYIEVKSLSVQWDLFSVGMSAAQIAQARTKGAQYWLYVVEDVESAQPFIHCIQDPASKISDYRFDCGWRHVAESHPAPTPETLPVAASGKRSILDARPPRRDEPDTDQIQPAGS